VSNLSKLEAKYVELGKEIEALKVAESDPRFKPKMFGCYFTIGSLGEIVALRWNESNNDILRLENGLVIETKEEAEKHAKRLKVFNLQWAYSRGMENHGYNHSDIALNNNNIHFAVRAYKGNTPILHRPDAEKVASLIGHDVIKEAWSDE